MCRSCRARSDARRQQHPLLAAAAPGFEMLRSCLDPKSPRIDNSWHRGLLQDDEPSDQGLCDSMNVVSIDSESALGENSLPSLFRSNIRT
jgi:hypothetical protein